MKNYCFIGQSCLDVQKSAFSELVTNRTGDRIYAGLQGTQLLPNTWIKSLPGTFNTLNQFISLGNINANYFQSPKKAVIEILPLEDHTPKAQ